MPPPELIEILRCPQTGQALTLAPSDLVGELTGRITRAGGSTLRNQSGAVVETPLDGALLRSDGGAVYPIRDGIPVMLVDEAILLPLA